MRLDQFKHLSFVLAGGAATCLLAAQPSTAEAQTPTAGADNTIIVTANKREQSLLEVPMAVTAVSGDTLQETRTFDVQDLQIRVPGLRLFARDGGSQNRVIIRGQNAGGDGATVVSLLDEVPLSLSGANNGGGFVIADFDTYDLQRVEVLRGPQGTLYGAAASAGLIKYVTSRPDPSEFAGGVEVSGYTFEDGGTGGALKGYANLPLVGGEGAVRITGFYEDVPGFVDNSFSNKTDVNSGERYAGRLQVLLNPTSNLSVRLLGMHQVRAGDGTNAVATQQGTLNPLRGYDAPSYFDQDFEIEYNLAYADIEYDFGSVTLQSITSYAESTNTADSDPGGLDVTLSFLADEPLAPFGARQPLNPLTSSEISVEKFSQELRLASEERTQLGPVGMDWQVGLFYTSEDAFLSTDQTLLRQNGSAFTGPGPGVTLQTFTGLTYTPQQYATLIRDRITSTYEAIAGYADATLHFNDRLSVQLGGRLERNETSAVFVTGGSRGQILGAFAGLSVPFQTIRPEVGADDTVFTYSVAPRLQLTDKVQAYVRVATGYRPGGPQIALPGEAASSFKSDSTTNYELGLKGLFFDDQLSVDVAAFRIDWKDIQVAQGVIANGVPITRTNNAGEALSQGLEWAFVATPKALDGLELGWLGAVTSAELTESAPGVGGLDGDDLPFVPDFTTTLSASYEAQITENFTGFVGVDWSYTGSRKTDFTNGGAGFFELPDYELVGARIGLRSGGFTAQIYGSNLTEELAFQSFFPGGLGSEGAPVAAGSVVRPRTIGLVVSKEF